MRPARSLLVTRALGLLLGGLLGLAYTAAVGSGCSPCGGPVDHWIQLGTYEGAWSGTRSPTDGQHAIVEVTKDEVSVAFEEGARWRFEVVDRIDP